eukprot:9885246-Alexandrium_andersonii.AAC.1
MVPASVGNNGPSERPSCWLTNDRWSRTAQAGHMAASKHRVPPGRHPQTQYVRAKCPDRGGRLWR